MSGQGDLFGRQRDTLAEARAAVEIGRETQDGVTCPCCGQFAKVYRRKLNRTMAQALILIYRHARGSDEWIHIPTLLVRSTLLGDAAKLAYWGLLEPQVAERDDGSRRVGFYRMTDRGRRFVLGQETIARHVITYNQQVLGFSDEHTTIRQALGDRFNYDELMAATP